MKDTRSLIRPLPKRRKIEAEQLADAALGIHDLAVHLAGGQIDEFRRKIGDQRLEAQALFEFRMRVDGYRRHRLIPVTFGE